MVFGEASAFEKHQLGHISDGGCYIHHWVLQMTYVYYIMLKIMRLTF